MSRRILVVDDDHDMVRTLCDILVLSGWDPTGAYSGSEAVTAARGQSFGWVLMDIRMPGMDGVEAFRTMKQSSPAIRVVLMTAHAAPEVRAAAVREGAVRVMTKPLDMPELLQLLHEQAPAA